MSRHEVCEKSQLVRSEVMTITSFGGGCGQKTASSTRKFW
jgi:hypothetical protein